MKKNIIWLIVISLVYIPVILFDLSLFLGNALSHPCGFVDFKCLIEHNAYNTMIGNILGLFAIFLLNLIFIIPIVTFIRNIKQELNKTTNGGNK